MAKFNPQIAVDEFTIDDRSYPIAGKMIAMRVTIPEFEFQHLMQSDSNIIKETIVHQLAEKLLENKLVEFTQMQSPIMGERIINCRMYVTPDSDVRLLREFVARRS